MAKKICCVCNKTIWMILPKASLSDGLVCGDCLKKIGMSSLNNSNQYTCESIKQLIEKRTRMLTAFKPTKAVSYLILIDEINKLFKISNDVFEYANLLSFELLEDGQTITKGGLGRAIAGGLIFGGVGAVVGSITGSKKTKGLCTSMKIRITLRNAHVDTVYIPLINNETKTNSLYYKNMRLIAQSCICALEIIADQNNSKQVFNSNVNAVSDADEILKFKKLLDEGIITQNEFEAKKKQLLGM